MNLQRTIYRQYYFIIKYEIYEISLFMNNNANRISIFKKLNTLRIIQRTAVLIDNILIDFSKIFLNCSHNINYY